MVSWSIVFISHNTLEARGHHYKVKSLLRNDSLDFANITTKVLLLTRGWLRPHWTQATKTLGLRWKEKMVTHFRMNESSLFKRIDIAIHKFAYWGLDLTHFESSINAALPGFIIPRMDGISERSAMSDGGWARGNHGWIFCKKLRKICVLQARIN